MTISHIFMAIFTSFNRCVLALAMLILAGNAATALDIFTGHATQGGMVIIKTDPLANLTIDDQALAVSENGFAVIGFHRDDIAPVDVIAIYPDGRHDTLTITPIPREFNEQRIDGLPQNMVTPPQDVLDRIARERKEVSQARADISDLNGWQQNFIWPSHGIITGVYGSRRILNGQPRAPHYGIDIAATAGTPVKAPADGVITMVDDLYFTGITIIMDHGHGISSTFLHLDKANIPVGMAVKQGDIIGEVGSTGRSTGAHLDWRINWFTKRLDPALLAGSMPNS